MLVVPLYFQEVRGISALQAGLILIAQGAGALAVRSFIGRLSDNVGARWLVVVGFFVVLLGTVPFAFADAGTSWGAADRRVVRPRVSASASSRRR